MPRINQRMNDRNSNLVVTNRVVMIRLREVNDLPLIVETVNAEKMNAEKMNAEKVSAARMVVANRQIESGRKLNVHGTMVASAARRRMEVDHRDPTGNLQIADPKGRVDRKRMAGGGQPTHADQRVRHAIALTDADQRVAPRKE